MSVQLRNLAAFKQFFEGGSKTIGHSLNTGLRYCGKQLAITAQKVMELIQAFIKNMPYYRQIAIDYSKLGMEHLKTFINFVNEHRKDATICASVGGVIATMTIIFSAIIYNNLFSKAGEDL